MDTQIYLMLCRLSGKWPKSTAATAGLVVKQLLTGFVWGDSLDVPFVKMIRVQDVSHEIALGSTEDTIVYKTMADGTVEAHTVAATDPTKTYHEGAKWKPNGNWFRRKALLPSGEKPDDNNLFAKGEVPEHGDFQFTKLVDNATPILAYSCSGQEVFPFAFFFFRRRGGAGLGGIRQPFFSLGLYKCTISGWSVDDDTESVKLKYSHIAWASLDTWGDSDKPIGIPGMKTWNLDANQGSDFGVLSLILQGVGQALTVVAGAAVGADLGKAEF